jgi:3-oxoacyl-[acyl-carrier protein] reductase
VTDPVVVPPVPSARLPGLSRHRYLVVGGASGGVGTATVAMLSASQAQAIVVDRAGGRLDRLGELFPETVTGVCADVTTDEGIDAVERALADVDLHGLVNVVGGVSAPDVGHFLELTPGQWRRAIDLNLGYAVRTGQIVARRIVAGRHGGSIVNLSVADARGAMPWFSAYGAARSALEGVTRTMAVELGPFGIRANTVAWGLINSPRAHSGAGSDGSRERDLIPLGRRGTVADVASTVSFLLSDLAGYITGQSIAVDGGLSLHAAHYGAPPYIPEFVEDGHIRQELLDRASRIVR